MENNRLKASHAGWALNAYRNRVAPNDQMNGQLAQDLLADLMHWCDMHGESFDDLLSRASDHYGFEKLNHEK